MKTPRRFASIALAALLLAGPLAAALPDAEMAGADGSAPSTSAEKKPTPRAGTSRKHRGSRPEKRIHRDPKGAATDRSSSLERTVEKSSSSVPG